MSRLYLPDTNAFSRYFRGRDDALTDKLVASFSQLRLSPLVLAELEYGAAKSGVARHRLRIDQLLLDVPVEPFMAEDSVRYGRLRALLERRGEIIGAVDLLIAAQAIRLDAVIVTHNTAGFARVPGLKIEDWQTA